jgi:hypothetical protein
VIDLAERIDTLDEDDEDPSVLAASYPMTTRRPGDLFNWISPAWSAVIPRCSRPWSPR